MYDWIDVNAELPNECETVVIFCYFGGTIYRDLTFERISGKYVAQYVDGVFYVDGEEQTCVTHWMRLPKDPISKGGIDIDSI